MDGASRVTEAVPVLQPGDHLSVAEFERRYQAMPHVKKAELIEGVVYMPSPVSRGHGTPHGAITTWLGVYWAQTAGTEMGDNTTVRMEYGENCPQPDVYLRVLPEHGGQSKTSADDYVEGAPELAAEIAASSVSYDLHEKLVAYQRNGVQEYVVWRVEDEAIDWLVLRDGEYKPLRLTGGLYKSRAFPGLWLDPAALVQGGLARVLQVVQQGVASAEHKRFVARLQRRKK